ncbi:MAG TPA: hypothetical protein VFK58_08630 [Sphingomicrobium sp.]|nr:hypothetical protein [Sphingomicrobium sp.]
MSRSKAPRLLAASAAALLAATAALAMPQFGSWSGPQNLEALPGSQDSDINTTFVDGCASHTADGLTIYFNSDRDGSHDIYMASRASKSDGFGAPQKLPAPINTATGTEACPTISRSGNSLYFLSSRDDAAGDIVASKRGPKGWSNPVNLGPNINQAGLLDETPTFYEDDQGREVMIFSRRGPGEPGVILQSIEGGPASPVQFGPNSSAADNRPSVTHDGLTIFFDSNRGAGGPPDLYYATRSSVSDPFGTAVRLTSLSEAGFDARPYISWDGTFLTFSSGRAGNASPAPDIWFATREKATGN